MKKYEKPNVNVIDLQIKENIAAVDTTVFVGTAATMSQGDRVQMALTEAGTGLAARDGLVAES